MKIVEGIKHLLAGYSLRETVQELLESGMGTSPWLTPYFRKLVTFVREHIPDADIKDIRWVEHAGWATIPKVPLTDAQLKIWKLFHFDDLSKSAPDIGATESEFEEYSRFWTDPKKNRSWTPPRFRPE